MQLDALTLIHLCKGAPPASKAIVSAAVSAVPVFHWETCQREIWLLANPSDEVIRSVVQAVSDVVVAEVYRGREAYRFLLQVATGLESEIAGETDVFGQLKQAWQDFAKQTARTGLDTFNSLDSWMQRIFEDTKEIRSRHLQNLGGVSYGSLVRRLIRSRSREPLAKQPILMIGAGQIVQSVVPYLEDYPLWVWNRSEGRLAELERELSKNHSSMENSLERRFFSAEAKLSQALKQATHLIVGVPADAFVLPKSLFSYTTVVHLGGLRGEFPFDHESSNFFTLSDLFEMQKSQNEARMAQIRQALRACEEKAKLRSLGVSLSIPHGWEDLAVFA